jgi:hypothetical protein
MSGLLDDSTPRFTIRDAGTIVALVLGGAFGWANLQTKLDGVRETQIRQEKRIELLESQKTANAVTLARICQAVRCDQKGIEE